MIETAVRLTPTSVIGLAAYGLTAASCIAAWGWARRGGRVLRFAAVAAAIETALFFDIAFNWRWMLHGELMSAARQRNVYQFRRDPQSIGLLILLVLLLAGCGLIVRAYRGRAWAVLARWGLLLSLTLWIMEVISLHQADAILYSRIGPFMCISFVWISAALITSGGVLVEAARG